MLAQAALRGIKKLSILGDFLASDAFSMWPTTATKLGMTDYADEAMLGVDLVTAMFSWFDEIYLIEGNHDRRANKATKGELHLQFLLNLAFKFHRVRPLVTRLNHMWLNSPRGPWLMHHPQRGYSRIPGRLPRSYWEVMPLPKALRDKYGPIKPHVIGTHTHHLADVMSPDGQCQFIEIGCCRDPLKFWPELVVSGVTKPARNVLVPGFRLCAGLPQARYGEARAGPRLRQLGYRTRMVC